MMFASSASPSETSSHFMVSLAACYFELLLLCPFSSRCLQTGCQDTGPSGQLRKELCVLEVTLQLHLELVEATILPPALMDFESVTVHENEEFCVPGHVAATELVFFHLAQRD